MADEVFDLGPRALCTVHSLEQEPHPDAVKFREVMEAAGYEVNLDDDDYPEVVESATGLDEILQIAKNGGVTVGVYGDMPDEGMVESCERFGVGCSYAED